MVIRTRNSKSNGLLFLFCFHPRAAFPSGLFSCPDAANEKDRATARSFLFSHRISTWQAFIASKAR